MNFYSKFEKFLQATGDDAAGWVLFLIFAAVGASALGLSVYLRSGNVITVRALSAVLLHSSVWAIVVFLMGWSTLKSDVPMLLGLSILSGIGTASVLDVALVFLKMKFGINVTFTPPKN